jgi:large subunit ribosomal protein L31
MKSGIHPKLKVAKVICTGCGNEFETLSVKENITVSICNNCHPFFTGTKKILDAEGRVQKFERRYKQAQEQKEKQQEQKDKQAKKKELLKKASKKS